MEEAPKRYRGPVHGLRSFDSGGIITVYDAKTMKIKRHEESKSFEEIIKVKKERYNKYR
jgi:hypothetical protein